MKNEHWPNQKPFRKINEAEKRLVKALRSGNYKQTDGALRNGDSFCCLGVACDISGVGEWDGEDYLSNSLKLPSSVKGQLEWTDHEGELDPIAKQNLRIKQYQLSEMNDDGIEFEVIARVIELGAVQKA